MFIERRLRTWRSVCQHQPGKIPLSKRVNGRSVVKSLHDWQQPHLTSLPWHVAYLTFGSSTLFENLDFFSSQLPQLRHRRSGKSHEFPYTWEQPHPTRCVLQKKWVDWRLGRFFFALLHDSASFTLSLYHCKKRKSGQKRHIILWDSMRGPFVEWWSPHTNNKSQIYAAKRFEDSIRTRWDWKPGFHTQVGTCFRIQIPSYALGQRTGISRNFSL